MGWVKMVIFHCLSTSNRQTRTTIFQINCSCPCGKEVSSSPGHNEAMYCFTRVLRMNDNFFFFISYKNNKIDQSNPLLNEIQYTVGNIFK